MADRLPGQTDQSDNGRYFADLARATFVDNAYPHLSLLIAIDQTGRIVHAWFHSNNDHSAQSNIDAV